MRITFEEVLAAPGGLVRRVIAEAIPSGAPEVTFVGAVRGHVELRAVGSRVRVSGETTTDIEMVCSRCLCAFTRPVDTVIEEVFDPRPATERMSTEGGALILPSPEAAIDVSELLRQHLLLALPYTPLCRADCAGLCPVCGADRNQTSCHCSPTINPGFAVLRNALHPKRGPHPRADGPRAEEPRRSG